MKLEDLKSPIKNKDQYRLYSLIKKHQDAIDEIRSELNFKRDVLKDLYQRDERFQEEIDHFWSAVNARLGRDSSSGVPKEQMTQTERKRVKKINKETQPFYEKMRQLEHEIESMVEDIEDHENSIATYKHQLHDVQQHGTKKDLQRFWKNAYRHEEAY